MEKPLKICSPSATQIRIFAVGGFKSCTNDCSGKLPFIGVAL